MSFSKSVFPHGDDRPRLLRRMNAKVHPVWVDDDHDSLLKPWAIKETFESYQSQVLDREFPEVKEALSPTSIDSDAEVNSDQNNGNNRYWDGEPYPEIPKGIPNPFLLEDSQAEPWRIRQYLTEVMGKNHEVAEQAVDSSKASAGSATVPNLDGSHYAGDSEETQVLQDHNFIKQNEESNRLPQTLKFQLDCHERDDSEALPVARPLAKRARTSEPSGGSN